MKWQGKRKTNAPQAQEKLLCRRSKLFTGTHEVVPFAPRLSSSVNENSSVPLKAALERGWVLAASSHLLGFCPGAHRLPFLKTQNFPKEAKLHSLIWAFKRTWLHFEISHCHLPTSDKQISFEASLPTQQVSVAKACLSPPGSWSPHWNTLCESESDKEHRLQMRPDPPSPERTATPDTRAAGTPARPSSSMTSLLTSLGWAGGNSCPFPLCPLRFPEGKIPFKRHV